MAKVIKNALANFLVICLIFLMVVGWIFSGWPQIWQNPPFPPEIQEAKAASEGPNSPTSGSNSGDWTNPDNAISDGSGAAVTTAKNTEHTWWGFGFSIPNDNTIIDGIEVICDAWTGTDGPDNAEIYLSWDGSSWTAAKTQIWPSPSEDTITSGSSTDTWGRAWSTTEINSDNFRVKVKSIASGKAADDWDLDWIRIKVYYTEITLSITAPANVQMPDYTLGGAGHSTRNFEDVSALVQVDASVGFTVTVSSTALTSANNNIPASDVKLKTDGTVSTNPTRIINCTGFTPTEPTADEYALDTAKNVVTATLGTGGTCDIYPTIRVYIDNFNIYIEQVSGTLTFTVTSS
ncbi:hypothetical protein KJA14_02740 [Patescibacteria group bacterium]|nr:hypothetical protein [Patescibacteria group bacterium]